MKADAYVETTPELLRPTDIRVSVGDPTKAKAKLDWSADITMPRLINRLVDAELARRQTIK